MYQLVSAIGKKLAKGSRWTAVSIGSMQLKEIFSTYQRVYATLVNTVANNQLIFDLESIRAKQSASVLTFNEFLVANGAATLTAMNSTPSLKLQYVKYTDAHHADYSVDIIHPYAPLSSKLPDSEKTWGYMTNKRITDYTLFYKHCMVSVNGFFHLIDADSKGIYIMDAAKTLRKTKQSTVGIHSFLEIGELEYIQFKPEMISRHVTEIPMNKRTLIKTDVDMTGKIPILVVGGYLHIFDDKTFYTVNEKTLCINFQNYPFLNRFYEMKDYLNLDSLELEKTIRNDTQVSIENILSDAVITKLLTLNQSFLVLLTPKSDVFVDHIPVEDARLPGMLVSEIKPDLPMIGGFGRIMEYWPTLEDGKYSLTVNDDYRNVRQYETVKDWKNLISVADHREPMKRVSKGPTYFKMIGTDLVI